MPLYELLEANRHHQLRMVADDKSLSQFTPIVVSEFAAAATACPIVLTKHPQSGEFIAGAIVSLKPDEPPLKSLGERGGFEPLFFQTRGFYVSEQSIAVDREDPRFSLERGELLFTETRQPAECLRRIQSALGALQVGQEATRKFVRAMLDHQLIEPINLSFQFDRAEPVTLRGLYTLSLDKFNQLDESVLIEFFKAGYAEFVYLMAFSLKQFAVLAHLRNEQLAKAEKQLA